MSNYVKKSVDTHAKPHAKPAYTMGLGSTVSGILSEVMEPELARQRTHKECIKGTPDDWGGPSRI